MEAIKFKKELFENNEFLKFLDNLLQKKIDSYNLELLVQCERKGNTNSITFTNIQELKKMREEIISLKNFDKVDNLISLISENKTIKANANQLLQVAV